MGLTTTSLYLGGKSVGKLWIVSGEGNGEQQSARNAASVQCPVLGEGAGDMIHIYQYVAHLVKI